MILIKLDLHVHSNYSIDGKCGLGEIVLRARARGLSGFALTDHNTIAGHGHIRKFQGRGFLIIPGEEITSSKGHVVALGVRELIPRDLSPAETVERIEEQGGVAIAAHPFSPGRNPNLVYSARFHAVEALNGRAFFPANKLAQNYARATRTPMVAGSDAHRCDEVGLTFTLFDCEPKLEAVLEQIRKGRTRVGGKPLSFPQLVWRSIQKVLKR